MMAAPRLDISEVSKTFPGVRALDDVSVRIDAGEIHALLGDNGAGKSTLGKIIAGVHRADGGLVKLDGTELVDIDERDAGKLGIAIVHQEGSLVGQLSVSENVFAGRQPTRWPGRIDRGLMNRQAADLIARLGVSIDPRRRVSDLSPAEAQVVEIAKCLSLDLRVLILDGPTAALTLTETERLFEIVRAGQRGRHGCLCLAPAGGNLRAVPPGDRAERRPACRHAGCGGDHDGRSDPHDGRP